MRMISELLHVIKRLFARDFQNFLIQNQVTDAKSGQAGLTGTCKFPWSSNLQIRLGDLKSILGSQHRLNASFGFFRQLRFCRNEPVTIRLFGSPPDPATQLMQLRKAKSLGMFDHHDTCVCYIDSDFYHRRSYQHLNLSFQKVSHDLFTLPRRNTAMNEPDAQTRKGLPELQN